MAKLEPVYAPSGDSMVSLKRRGNRVPLPYLIRPRKKLPVYDSFALYNDYIEYSSVKDGFYYESDDEDSSMDAVETSSLEKGDSFGLRNEGHPLNDEKDVDYVVVDSVEPTPNSKREKAGAIQMMELSKDAVHDDWVVV